MRKCFFLFTASLLLLFSSTSCSTTETVVEYVPVKMDLTDVIDPVLVQRPDNTLLKVVQDPQDMLDVLENSETYLYAWGLWEDYADSLEKTLVLVRDKLKE